MDQQLPPPVLVTTWLNVIHSVGIPQDIVNNYKKIVCYYFSSLELAYMYVEQNEVKQNEVKQNEVKQKEAS